MHPAVSVRDVAKSFRDRGRTIDALSDVSLDVAAGAFVSLIGPSGCGKTTLLRAIGGLVDVDGGWIEVDGAPPSALRSTKGFGLVPQTPALAPWRTVRENVELVHTVNTGVHTGANGGPMPQSIDELLDRVGLAGFADALPAELSGGMQQRVAVARAFSLGARVLLMDEPFSALDELTRSEMHGLLLDLCAESNPTVIFVTHSVSEAVALSDRVAIMTSRPGSIAEVIDIDLERSVGAALVDEPEFHDHVVQVRSSLAAAASIADGRSRA